MKIARFGGLAVLVAVWVAGCSKQAEEMAPPPPMSGASSGMPAPAPAPADAPAMAGESRAAEGGGGEQAAPKAAIPRKIIYEGYVTLEAEQVGQVLAKVTALARRMGGYEGNMEQSAAGRQSASVVLRVPAEKFGALMEALTKLGRVMSRRVEAKDVGEEWVDLEARIKTKRQEEQRLLALLEKAGSVTALLEVERELSRVRGEIEQAQGRLRYLGNQVELSTIHVEIHSPAGVAPKQSWQADTIIKRACQDFLVIGQGVLSLVIYVLVMLPFWLPVVALIWWARRRAGGDEPSL